MSEEAARRPAVELPQRVAPALARSGLGTLQVLLALLTAVGPISTDMYLPAFPEMRAELEGGPSAAPLTLAAWFGGLAVGQLVHGPLSDRLGRRAPLLLGSVLYVLASAACALATDMAALIACRALAAFGGAAGLVVPRAVIRDVATDSEQAARIFSRLQLIMSAVPMLAPTLGGVIVQLSGWRAIFWVAAAYGAVCVLFVRRSLPETLPPGARGRGGIESVVLDYLGLLRDRGFVTHALTGGFATFSLFAFLGGAPAVFLRHFGMSPLPFGALFIANAAGFALGANLNVRAIRRFGRPRALTLAVGALLAASALMLLLALGDAQGLPAGGLWGIEAPMIAIMVRLGCLLPDAAIGAIEPHVRDAGAASAMYGTTVFAVGAFGTAGAGWAATGTAVPMAGMLLLGALAALGCSLLRPRTGDAAGGRL